MPTTTTAKSRARKAATKAKRSVKSTAAKAKSRATKKARTAKKQARSAASRAAARTKKQSQALVKSVKAAAEKITAQAANVLAETGEKISTELAALKTAGEDAIRKAKAAV